VNNNLNVSYGFGVSPEFYFDGVHGLYVVRRDLNHNGTIYKKFALTVNGWSEVGEGMACVPLHVPTDDLVVLADELWKNKIKPPEFFHSTGEQAATEKHLEDMRKIAFLKLGIK
jgi:hypothetical protein